MRSALLFAPRRRGGAGFGNVAIIETLYDKPMECHGAVMELIAGIID
jgi:hypothetical protein